MLKKFNLKDKFALITGAGGLLGNEHAHSLLECGANIILTDINTKNLDKTFSSLKAKYKEKVIIKMKMDVTSETSIKKCKNYLKRKKIFVNILINNASFNPKSENLRSLSFENYDYKKWEREIRVGLTGAFLCSKIFGSEMAKKKEGVILNISSDLSIIAPDQRIYNTSKKYKNVKPVTYSVAKTGLIGLTKYLATYWAPQKIRCNAISPAGIFDGQNKSFVKKIKKLIPLERMAERDEYRSAVQFLCSEASSYMTGQNIIIDGGRSIWWKKNLKISLKFTQKEFL